MKPVDLHEMLRKRYRLGQRPQREGVNTAESSTDPAEENAVQAGGYVTVEETEDHKRKRREDLRKLERLVRSSVPRTRPSANSTRHYFVYLKNRYPRGAV